MDSNNKSITMETEICHNCKRQVPQQNYLMHVAHCARNMTVCPVCGDAVPKAHLKDHRQKEHALVECPACRNKVQAGAMNRHRAKSCGRRTVVCEYCELELPKDDLPEHESYCGARTERCDDCGELVMHKYKKLHLDSNHGFLKLNDEPGPTASWETPANRPRVPAQNGGLNSMRTLSNCLVNSTTTTTNTVTNNNNCEEVPLKSKQLDEENGFTSPSSSGIAPRDVPRTFVPAYDASEDLRAKVKLARHDLNNIKHTYLVQGEERVRQLQHQVRQIQLPRGPELTATNKAPRSRFTTNLVPYEKNKSVRVNALPDEERAAVVGNVLQPLPSMEATATGARPASGYFNYLGAREEATSAPIMIPLSRTLTNGNHAKNDSKKPATTTTTPSSVKIPPSSNTTNSNNSNNNNNNNNVNFNKMNGNGKGAVPRVSRKKGPAPPIPTSPVKALPTHTNNHDHEEVNLPCEFCSVMVKASDLVQHETACRPDLAQLRVPKSTTSTAEACSGGAAAAAFTPPASPEVQLPCEFCCNLYPASRLLSHQALCDN